MLENKFQANLIKELKERFPGCIVMKNDPTYIQGIPDLLVLHKDKWASLECKKSAGAKKQPNQEYYVDRIISTVAGEYTVPQGYHDGSGKVSIDATEQAKLIATNIREGVTILGVEGAMSGSEDMKPQSKEVTPSKEAQTIMPDEEYNCLSQVTVKAIPYVETDNSAGGKTVTIG